MGLDRYRLKIGTGLYIGLLTTILATPGYSADAKENGFDGTAEPDYRPADSWKTAIPEEQGMDSEWLYKMDRFIAEKGVDIHCFLIIRHGYLVVDGCSDGHEKDTIHFMASITKSVTAALVGIAIDQGYIKGVDQTLADFFGKDELVNDGSGKQAVSLHHLLTMTSGFDWPEERLSYNNPENIVNQMILSKNWTRFILARPIAASAQAEFNYNSGNSHLLSFVLRRATGMDVLSYAKKNLFEPLGITNVHWSKDPQGIPIGGFGLCMNPSDWAKIGYLYLKEGVSNGRQIISKDWIAKSTKNHVQAGSRRYGYHWWLLDTETSEPVSKPSSLYAAMGNKGQRIYVIPELDMVVVIAANLGEDESDLPETLLKSYIIKATKSSGPLNPNPAAFDLLRSELQKRQAANRGMLFSHKKEGKKNNGIGVNGFSACYERRGDEE
jgi:CubicO group peptidase (beta-lactamase class C family)